MEDERQRRIAANQSVFRDVNEAIERGLWPGEERSASAFRCECARPDCNEMVALTPEEYEGVRANPRCFIVLPGHQASDVETVVEERGGYLIVEKCDEAGKAAE